MMNTQDRILDINSLGIFNDTEVEQDTTALRMQENSFKSIEYFLIVHLTNEELYYMSHDEIPSKFADLIKDTEKGRIYCYS